MIVPGPAELLAMSVVIVPQSLVAAFIAKRRGRRFWVWFFLSIAVTIGAALVMLLPFIRGGVAGRLLTIAAVFLAAPVLALCLKRRGRPASHTGDLLAPDALPSETMKSEGRVSVPATFGSYVLTILLAVAIGYLINLTCLAFCYRTALASDYAAFTMGDLLRRSCSHYRAFTLVSAIVAVLALVVALRASRTAATRRRRILVMVPALTLAGLCTILVIGRTYASRSMGDVLIADSPHTPIEWLRTRANTSTDAVLLRHIASNPNCPRDVLERLSVSTLRGVKRTASRRLEEYERDKEEASLPANRVAPTDP